MDVRYSPDKNGFKSFTTDEIRRSFLIGNLFLEDQIPLVYSDVDRSITGSAVPVRKSLKLAAAKKEMAADYFAQRRELGVINIGSKGEVSVDKQNFIINKYDALYIGRGSKDIRFQSADPKKPAMFYFVSYPAHQSYPTIHIRQRNAEKVVLGKLTGANKRTIYKYILPGKVDSCQLVMGLTVLEKGSVWNTMPAHTHQRRSEIYMYFGLNPDSIVFHILGDPSETRHIIVRDKQAVLSTSWSMHAGVGTQNYSFIWAMGGENQEFDDMDWIPMENLK